MITTLRNKIATAIRDTPEAGGEYVENMLANPPLPGAMADAFADAALQTIANHIGVAPDRLEDIAWRLKTFPKGAIYLKYSHGCWCEQGPTDGAFHSTGCEVAALAMRDELKGQQHG